MALVAHEQSSASGTKPRLRLRHAGQAIIVDDGHLILTIGRGPESVVNVQDRRASRNHASIELKNGHFILTDTSTNGTYVAIEGEPEIRFRQGECVLRGKGTISFATSRNSVGAEIAEFEQLSDN